MLGWRGEYIILSFIFASSCGVRFVGCNDSVVELHHYPTEDIMSNSFYGFGSDWMFSTARKRGTGGSDGGGSKRSRSDTPTRSRPHTPIDTDDEYDSEYVKSISASAPPVPPNVPTPSPIAAPATPGVHSNTQTAYAQEHPSKSAYGPYGPPTLAATAPPFVPQNSWNTFSSLPRPDQPSAGPAGYESTFTGFQQEGFREQLQFQSGVPVGNTPGSQLNQQQHFGQQNQQQPVQQSSSHYFSAVHPGQHISHFGEARVTTTFRRAPFNVANTVV